MSQITSAAIGLLSVLIFVFLTSLRLNLPGLYYDEVFQAVPAFFWFGKEPAFFATFTVAGKPVLQLSYLGAIKPALLALYMRITGRPFSVALTRWFGILVVAAGWMAFSLAAGRRLGRAGLIAFVLLALTDVTILLTTRHDWGPTTLALTLRFAVLALWLSNERLPIGAQFAVGLFIGLSMFEKLSSVVLVAPLALLWSPASLAGLATGGSPLLIVNAASWFRTGKLISISELSNSGRSSFLRFWFEYLTLAQGSWVRVWILDLPVASPWLATEGLLLSILLALAFLYPPARPFAAAYLGVGALLYLLPRVTEAHHWIIGTPFQYAAIALLVAQPHRFRVGALVLLAILLCVRLWGLSATVTAILAGHTGWRFDPSLTAAAAWLAQQSDAFVVASTWGIGAQVICLAQGRERAIHEPFFDEERLQAFRYDLTVTQARRLLLVEATRHRGGFPKQTQLITAEIEADLRWREVPAPQFAVVHIRQFVAI